MDVFSSEGFGTETRTVPYVNDGYTKGQMSVTLQVLEELKSVLKEDGGLDLNVSKTSILPKGTTQQTVFDVVHNILPASPALIQFNGDVSLPSFCPEGLIGIGVPIGTDVFVRNTLEKGTTQHSDAWDTPTKTLTHMVLHLPHAEGGFGGTSGLVVVQG
jgi:hypothetical protein